MQPEPQPADEAEYRAFLRELFSVRDKILERLEANRPLKFRDIPETWDEMKVRLRTTAEDLMLCTNVDRVVDSLMADHTTALLLIETTTETDRRYLIQTLERAFHAMPAKGDALPGQAMATFFLELCKNKSLILSAD
ncbi:MAG: hypothetical protein ABSG80_14520 [Verrucomicrobiota bacterium]|jgi:hypothetical protein